jgi:hypothetical protein
MPMPTKPKPKADGPQLPAVMKANKLIAGKDCPACSAAINLGADVHNCEQCGTSHHASCWDSGGCASGCTVGKKKTKAAADEGEGGDTQPCKFCGEAIKVGARKCRHCGEFQKESDRDANVKAKSGGTGEDMSTGDWVAALFCSGIGCIAGIIWCIQGKKKGPKMLGISFVMVVIWNIISAIVQQGSRR